MKPQGHIPESAPPSAHEASDLDPRLILRVTAIILGTLIFLIVMGLLLFRGFENEFPSRTSEAAPQVSSSQLPPEPRLQVNPAVDLQAVRTREDQHLQRYAWIDRSRGIAQIPINRAMELWVENYKPTTNSPPGEGVTEIQMRQQKAQEATHAP